MGRHIPLVSPKIKIVINAIIITMTNIIVKIMTAKKISVPTLTKCENQDHHHHHIHHYNHHNHHNHNHHPHHHNHHHQAANRSPYQRPQLQRAAARRVLAQVAQQQVGKVNIIVAIKVDVVIIIIRVIIVIMLTGGLTGSTLISWPGSQFPSTFQVQVPIIYLIKSP